MGRVFSATKHPWSLLSPDPQPYFLISQPSPPPEQTNNNAGGSDGLDQNISPGILLVIIIIAIIFFVCGLLHLLVRLLLYSPTSSAASRDPDDSEGVTALQGQLRQLFNLHDAGVDQTFIDALPVFHYKAIIGLKNPFDCAVCLCEFHPQDKLRLLPKCSHAFHVECIDTWLLSHSSCPLCRSSIIPDLAPDNTCAPVVFLLESRSESSREIVSDMSSNTLPARLSSNPFEAPQKYCEIPHIIDEIETPEAVVAVPEAKVVPVKLGKYRNVDDGREGSCSESADAGRRCFSMGSFEYVLDESSSLRVPIRTPANRKQTKKRTLPLAMGLQPAMSECDAESRREFDGFEACTSRELPCGGGGRSNESFSVSKTWLRAAGDSSRRAFSFRFPVNRNVGAAAADSLEAEESGCRRTMSEVELGKREMSSTFGLDDVNGGRMSLDSEGHAPSFARRTLLWLVGRQNRVVHSTDPNL